MKQGRVERSGTENYRNGHNFPQRYVVYTQYTVTSCQVKEKKEEIKCTRVFSHCGRDLILQHLPEIREQNELIGLKQGYCCLLRNKVSKQEQETFCAGRLSKVSSGET